MGSLSGLGIGLSLVFGCVLLGLVAELCYLLWWKKRVTNNTEIEDQYNNYTKELFYNFCWKKPSSQNTQELTSSEKNPEISGTQEQQPDLELGGLGKDSLLKGYGEDSVEAEIMRLHNLCGPPRFLFTINEETKEDLESEDGKSRKGSRTRSLSDLIVAIETPFLTPLSSPTTIKTQSLESLKNHHGFKFNPLFESTTDSELYRLRSSPPPKFKFLRDAEDKMMRRLIEEAEKSVGLKNGEYVQDCVFKASPNSSMVVEEDERDGSGFTFIVGKNNEREVYHHSNASKVLPLSSSPSTLKPLDNNKSTLQ